jgi:hypothetical protein
LFDKKVFPVEQIAHASILEGTRNFSSVNKLGRGGFGPVYKVRFGPLHDNSLKRPIFPIKISIIILFIPLDVGHRANHVILCLFIYYSALYNLSNVRVYQEIKNLSYS